MLFRSTSIFQLFRLVGVYLFDIEGGRLCQLALGHSVYSYLWQLWISWCYIISFCDMDILHNQNRLSFKNGVNLLYCFACIFSRLLRFVIKETRGSIGMVCKQCLLYKLIKLNSNDQVMVQNIFSNMGCEYLVFHMWHYICTKVPG